MAPLRAMIEQVSVLFSEPKIPQLYISRPSRVNHPRFSALQRAENSSIRVRRCAVRDRNVFQCSSASRKFLNCNTTAVAATCAASVSVLFSEPKIPQFNTTAVAATCAASVSVLFSEPKIPQLLVVYRAEARLSRFQCSSASRKFLNS